MYKSIRLLFKTAVALLIILLTVTAAVYVAYRLFPLKNIDVTEKYCNEYDVDIYAALSLIKAESNFNPEAVSHAGAYGIMQLTEDTFFYCAENLQMKVDKYDIFDVDKNIRAGIWYFSTLLKKYSGNISCAAAAYNAGAANVDKWLADESCSPDGAELKNIPYGETERHVQKIKSYIKIYKLLYPGLDEKGE